MLKEIENIKRNEDGPLRRWFSNPSLDLYVWYDDEGQITQFQLCYDKGPNGRALTWNHEADINHQAIDDGENRPFHMKSTPILVANEDFDQKRITRMFEDLAENIEHGIVRFVLEHIHQES